MPWQPPPRVRPLAVCVFREGDRILVFEGHDPVKGESFYRPIGGGIEFGEHGAQTIVREVREELGAEVENVRYLGAIENVYTYAGAPGHEVVLVYDGELADRSLYDRADLELCEGEGDERSCCA